MSDVLAVDCGTPYAQAAAGVLWLIAGGSFDVMPSWLVPGRAVWSWNGNPMLPPHIAPQSSPESVGHMDGNRAAPGS